MFDNINLESLIPKFQEAATLYGIKIIAAIFILILGKFIATSVRKLVSNLMTKSKVEPTLIKFVGNLVYIALFAFFIIAALGKLGIQTTSFVAILGAAGLAIGLALQGSLSNFAAGVLMLIFKPFKAGDFIEGAGVSGIVQEIGIFTTTIKSPDNKKIISPNAKITGDNIINYTAEQMRRLDLVAGVGYGDNLDKVQSVLLEILNNEPRVLKDPAPKIGVLSLGSSSVDFAVRPWVKTDEYWDVFFDLQKKIKVTFDEKGISIPFPQRDVHIFNEEK